eukprot:c10184_g1_i2.p1 GENE.c10184_g1_i2~~c10184_g1_i2.p1  ORF type:complete len:118 (-),score=31.30 c10184_g1_i2:16-369(-)
MDFREIFKRGIDMPFLQSSDSRHSKQGSFISDKKDEILEGYLKKDNLGISFQKASTRYFVLHRDGSLHYYTNETRQNYCGTILVGHALSVEFVEVFVNIFFSFFKYIYLISYFNFIS